MASQLRLAAEVEDLSVWRLRAQEAQLDDYALNALTAMFGYYDQHGLVGNPGVLQWLLGREPTPFSEVARR